MSSSNLLLLVVHASSRLTDPRAPTGSACDGATAPTGAAAPAEQPGLACQPGVADHRAPVVGRRCATDAGAARPARLALAAGGIGSTVWHGKAASVRSDTAPPGTAHARREPCTARRHRRRTLLLKPGERSGRPGYCCAGLSARRRAGKLARGDPPAVNPHTLHIRSPAGRRSLRRLSSSPYRNRFSIELSRPP